MLFQKNISGDFMFGSFVKRLFRPENLCRLLFCVTVLAGGRGWAADKSFEETIQGAKEIPGLFPLYFQSAAGKLLLAVEKLHQEFLYVNFMATGVGNNELGFDRGGFNSTKLVRFERQGNKLLLIQQNSAFRALNAEELERRSVRDAFPTSVLGAFPVLAESKTGALLIDVTAFFLKDSAGIAATLAKKDQAGYALDAERSAIYEPGLKNFPKNTEIEALLTFSAAKAGAKVEETAPDPTILSVRIHHSLMALPSEGFSSRGFDPRCGFFTEEYLDFAAPLAMPLKNRLIKRFRLIKKDAAEPGEPIEPIRFYVDRAVPEPIRSALVDGARWWNEAFEAAGFKNAFLVEVLPEDVDPLDIRYNVILWTHRSTRGWAYGSTVTDPRTGEIIVGRVRLDSQRARHVHLLAEALVADHQAGKPADAEVERMTLARIRQLSAHEVGHSLGLTHNFAASISDIDNASVMDYPFPKLRLNANREIDLSQAYPVGIGAWDKIAVSYGYRQFADPEAEAAGLARILGEAQLKGLAYVFDDDARPVGGASARGHLWDGGVKLTAELERLLELRAARLQRFSLRQIREGRPTSTLHDQFVLLYLIHRYQTEAVAKLVGGVDYTYSVRGDRTNPQIVGGKLQNQALDALLTTLSPDVLAVPESALEILPPHAYGYPKTAEHFGGRTGLVFDGLAAPEVAANLTLTLLLEPSRVSRMVQFQARDPQYPGLTNLLDRLTQAVWKARPEPGYRGEVQRVVNGVALYHLMALAANESAAPQARAVAFQHLRRLKAWFDEQAEQTEDADRSAHFLFLSSRIETFEKNPQKATIPPPIESPPGQPIGHAGCSCGCGW